MKRNCTYALLRYRFMGQCVLLYTLESGEPPSDRPGGKIVGKVFPTGPRSENAMAHLRSLHGMGIGKGQWRIPMPLAHLPELNMVLMEYLPGVSARALMYAEPHHWVHPHVIKSAARALTDLHQLPCASGNKRTINGDRIPVLRLAERFEMVAPELSQRITSPLAALPNALPMNRLQQRPSGSAFYTGISAPTSSW